MNDELIASNQKDDLSGLPTPREGYQWVKVDGFQFGYSDGDMALYADGGNWIRFVEGFTFQAGQFYGAAAARNWIARQVPTPEPEVIWETKGGSGLPFRILSDGSCEYCFAGVEWVKQTQTDTEFMGMVKEIANRHAKDKANTALLDSFYKLGERAEKWMAWHIDGGQDDTTEPESLNDIIDDFVEAYKEATNP